VLELGIGRVREGFPDWRRLVALTKTAIEFELIDS
jgi:hypothetical protein